MLIVCKPAVIPTLQGRWKKSAMPIETLSGAVTFLGNDLCAARSLERGPCDELLHERLAKALARVVWSNAEQPDLRFRATCLAGDVPNGLAVNFGNENDLGWIAEAFVNPGGIQQATPVAVKVLVIVKARVWVES